MAACCEFLADAGRHAILDLHPGSLVETETGRLDRQLGVGIKFNNVQKHLDRRLQDAIAAWRGDTDLDRDIDLTDYKSLVTNFKPLGAYGPYGWNSEGDGDVDLADYNALASNFKPLGYGAAAVPEPSTPLLALLGMLLFSAFGRLSVLK